jgi:phage repressor protein C with HTH and peptisase S24 domain
MIDPGALVKAREGKGLSQPALAKLAGCSQQLIGALEAGTTRTTKFLPKIARALEIDPGTLDSDWADRSTAPPPTDPPPLPLVADGYGPRDFPIYSAAEGGPGEILRSTDPVDWWPRPVEVLRVSGAYGMYVVGTSMEPEFEPGQVAVINPNLPHVFGKPYIFYGETEAGQVRASIKKIRHFSDERWYVRQHNPPEGQKHDFVMLRKIWGAAHRIVGRQDPF